MGTWNRGLYGNDFANDVKGTYLTVLKITQDPEKAYKYTLAEYKDDFGDDEPLFWYVLADQQLVYGILKDSVKNKAIDWIDKEGGMEKWEEEQKANKFRLTLNKLKDALILQTPQPKRIPRFVDINVWNMGDTYAIRLKREFFKEFGLFNKFVIVTKTGEGKSWKLNNALRFYPEAADICEKYPKISIIDGVFDEIPSIKEAVSFGCIEIIDGFYFKMPHKYIGLDVWDKNLAHYPKDDLVKLGVISNVDSLFPKEYLVEHRHYTDALSGWENIDLDVGKYIYTNIGYKKVGKKLNTIN